MALLCHSIVSTFQYLYGEIKHNHIVLLDPGLRRVCFDWTGESFVSEEAVAIPKLNKGYECSFGLATMETNKTGANHLKSIDNLIFLDDPQPASVVPQLT